MKKWMMTTAGASLVMIPAFFLLKQDPEQHAQAANPKGCVFMTLFGEEASEDFRFYKTPEQVQVSLDRGLDWMVKAQHNDGGWGAGSQSRQDVRDPHAVPADPATTSMVGMALLRTGSTITSGNYATQIKKALQYILNAVENTPASRINITSLTGTQIQSKLGGNIDVILAAQFLSNVKEHTSHDPALENRVTKALNTCVKKIQSAQNGDGSAKGAGWAGVLQSSLATNALESAEYSGAEVDKVALQKSRNYQKSNLDASTGKVNTDMGAGIVLYSVSGSGRAAAKEARSVNEDIAQAKKDGKVPASAPVNAETLEKIGYTKSQAAEMATSYEVYESAKKKSQQEDVMSGFGNNGGEEFLSYLQTGEAMVISKDDSWKNWYGNISGRLLKIQNNDGSWNGHHCITSPVFCTATCLLILSVNQDIDRLSGIGETGKK